MWEFLLEIVRKTNCVGTSIVMDAFHIYCRGGQEEDILKVSGDQISMFHINDVPVSKQERQKLVDGDRIFPGDGILNLSRKVRLLSVRVARSQVAGRGLQ